MKGNHLLRVQLYRTYQKTEFKALGQELEIYNNI